MRLPAFLPQSLVSYVLAETDEQLLEWLKKNPRDGLSFFIAACDDEGWLDKHHSFIHSLLAWITDQFYQRKLSQESANLVARQIYIHYEVLKNDIPFDLTLVVEEQEFAINSLLFALSSDYFFNLIFQRRNEHKERVLTLKEVTFSFFLLIEEFIRVGHIQNLWRHSQEEIRSLLRIAVRFGLRGLEENCAGTLKRYVNSTNLVDWILEAFLEGWLSSATFLFEMLNAQDLGIKLKVVKSSLLEEVAVHPQKLFLTMELIRLDREAILLFDKLKMIITHIICKGKLSENPEFLKILEQSPHLIGLDISESSIHPDPFEKVPSSVQELKLSDCGWLSAVTLPKIGEALPYLRELDLSSNVQMPFTAWKELRSFKRLDSLNLAHCHQIDDEIIELILLSVPRLFMLNLSDCIGVGELGFSKIADFMGSAIALNFSHTNITDAALAEIVVSCGSLQNLKLMRCRLLTEKGITKAISFAINHLKKIDLSFCRLTPETVTELRKLYPTLDIAF